MYMRLLHKADIYTKTDIVNNAGQRVPSWNVTTAGQRCNYMPQAIGMVRVSPTNEIIDSIYMYFPGNISLDANQRIYNIKDRSGNVIDPGPYEITSVEREPGFAGKVHHLKVRIVSVIES